MRPLQFKKYFYALPTLVFLGLVLCLSWSNRQVAGSLTQNLSIGGFYEYTGAMESHLADNLTQKRSFIELNGAMNRILGVNTVNGVERLKNGSLSTPIYPTDSVVLADKIKQLSDFLAEDGVGFLCVGAPRKESFHASQPRLGYSLHQQLPGEFVSLLRQRDVAHLDLDTWFRENGWSVEDTFFKTDHHWRPEAAFAAVGQIMSHFAAHYDVAYDSYTLNLDNWNIDVYEDWFLGSEGKRTGASYAGADDISHIYPDFPTDLRVGRINAAGQPDTAHEDTLYHTQHLQTRDLHGANPYDVYLGGNFPMTYIRNTKAVNDQRLVVIGDSFRTPAECFLATQFSEIYHIDMRYYDYGTFAQFARQIDADLVLLLFCGPEDGIIHNYGVDAWNETFAGKSPAAPLLSEKEIALEQTVSTTDYRVLASSLEPSAYELSLTGAELRRDRTVSTEGPGLFLQAALIDTHTGAVHATRYFLANHEGSQRWLFTAAESDTAEYALVLYNGVTGHTAGNSARIRDVSLNIYQ